MLPHEIPEFAGYPSVRSFLEHHVSMQFGDVREMLRLPLPALHMTHACNFAAASTLCGLVSGLSVSIHQPARNPCGSGCAFKQLLKDFYPWGAGQNRGALSAAVYDYYRNPLAHALGVGRAGVAGHVEISRLVLVDPGGMKQDTGLTEAQLTELEDLGVRPQWAGPGLTRAGNNRTLLVEGFYRDILEMLQMLAKDPAQMNAAENRFQQGTVIWRV